MPAEPPQRPTRREKAAATRERILAASYDLFCTLGYTATTMKLVADRSGVAVQTVYFVFHTKAELLSALVEDRAAGVPDPAPVVLRSWHQEAMDTPDGRRAIGLLVDNGVDIYARVAPLAHSIREAALVDPDVDALWSRISVSRKAAMGRQMEALRDRGQLRSDLSSERATDICHATLSHENYLDLVQRSGWEVQAYKAWLHRSLCEMLLDPEALSAPGGAEATSGLSFAGE